MIWTANRWFNIDSLDTSNQTSRFPVSKNVKPWRPRGWTATQWYKETILESAGWLDNCMLLKSVRISQVERSAKKKRWKCVSLPSMSCQWPVAKTRCELSVGVAFIDPVPGGEVLDGDGWGVPPWPHLSTSSNSSTDGDLRGCARWQTIILHEIIWKLEDFC